MRYAIILVLVLSSVAPAQDHGNHGGPSEKLGRVSFPVSCDKTLQPQFERAVAMLHSFWFEAADAAFSDIARADSTCALAYWGRAMTYMGNPMARISPRPDRLKLGLELAQRGRDLAQRATHREQMYADAALAFYKDYDKSDHFARMELQERALLALHQAHPDDMEATIFLARDLVANSPPSDQHFTKQLAAAELLQPLFDAHPDHPGLAHYLIHAYDAPPIANKGLKAAKAYAAIAPSAPHALHMPSHTFTRLGLWNESIETNQRSARAEPDSNTAVHAMDYMVYAYLQQGREREARAVLARATENMSRFYNGLLGYNLVAMPARYAVERSAWAEAAALTPPPAKELPYVRALTHFARAVGAARTGKIEQAKMDVDSLAAFKAQLDAVNNVDWSVTVDAQYKAASAWIALAMRDTAKAVFLARSAAELEETVEKSPVTPGPILPARELEGDMLMQLGRPADAQASYDKTLVREPRRFRALYGAARAADKAGNKAKARERYRELLDLMPNADASRTEPIAARKYLALK